MRTCIHCGCTDDDACVDPVSGLSCSWVSEDECSACVVEADAGDELVTPRRELILPGDPEFHL